MPEIFTTDKPNDDRFRRLGVPGKTSKEKAKKVLKMLEENDYMDQKEINKFRNKIKSADNEEVKKILDELSNYYMTMRDVYWMSQEVFANSILGGNDNNKPIPPKITEKTAKRLRSMISENPEVAKKVGFWLMDVDQLYRNFDRYERYDLIHSDGGLDAIKKLISEHPEQASTIYNRLQKRWEKEHERRLEEELQRRQNQKEQDQKSAEASLDEELDNLA